MSIINIPAGYQLHISTWENDGDSYATQIVSGLSFTDAAFYIDLVYLFSSVNNHNRNQPSGFGNDYVPSAKLATAIDKLMLVHSDISDDTRTKWNQIIQEVRDCEDDEDMVEEGLVDTLYDLLGTPSDFYYDGEYPFYRVCDRVEVFYFPFEVENVTKQFVGDNGDKYNV